MSEVQDDYVDFTDLGLCPHGYAQEVLCPDCEDCEDCEDDELELELSRLYALEAFIH